MRIDQMLCTACEECIPYCPVEAITAGGGAVAIDFDGCVECGDCLRYAPCPTNAILESPETKEWPRRIRAEFSNANVPHSSSTGGQGRGTEESKSNDVTGRVKRGRVGMGLEFGRPGIGTRLRDLEKMAVALGKIGVNFEPENPVTYLFADLKTGVMRDDVRDERVLSAILEFELDAERIPEVVQVIERVAEDIDTVFSWCAYTRLAEDGSNPLLPVFRDLGIEVRPNAKVNMGLGRPLAED